MLSPSESIPRRYVRKSRSGLVSMRGYVMRGSLYQWCRVRLRQECERHSTSDICAWCGRDLPYLPHESDDWARLGLDVEIEVEVSGDYQPAERMTRWDPGCDADVTDVMATHRLPDGREVEVPLTEQEREDYRELLLEAAES